MTAARDGRVTGSAAPGDDQRVANRAPAAPAPARAAAATSPAAPAPATASDEVDRLVAAWARERPGLDVSPLEVLSRVDRLARHLQRARRTAFAAHGLVAGEFDVLAALRRAGPPYALSPGDLLRRTMVTSGTMTNRVDRLALRQLVERGPDPRDGRGVSVRLTDAGRRSVDAAMTDLLAREQQILGLLSSGQREALGDMLRTLLAPLDNVRPEATEARAARRGPAAPGPAAVSSRRSTPG